MLSIIVVALALWHAHTVTRTPEFDPIVEVLTEANPMPGSCLGYRVTYRSQSGKQETRPCNGMDFGSDVGRNFNNQCDGKKTTVVK